MIVYGKNRIVSFLSMGGYTSSMKPHSLMGPLPILRMTDELVYNIGGMKINKGKKDTCPSATFSATNFKGLALETGN
jgi:hypothetical protein